MYETRHSDIMSSNIETSFKYITISSILTDLFVLSKIIIHIGEPNFMSLIIIFISLASWQIYLPYKYIYILRIDKTTTFAIIYAIILPLLSYSIITIVLFCFKNLHFLFEPISIF